MCLILQENSLVFPCVNTLKCCRTSTCSSNVACHVTFGLWCVFIMICVVRTLYCQYSCQEMFVRVYSLRFVSINNILMVFIVTCVGRSKGPLTHLYFV